MDFGVERFHAAVHHLGDAGVVAHADGFDAGILQHLKRAGCANDYDAQFAQQLGKLHDTGLVVATDNCPRYLGHGHFSRACAPHRDKEYSARTRLI